MLKWLYSGKNVCIRQSSCIWEKVVVLGHKLLCSGKSGCIRKKIGCILAKMVVFGLKLLYSGKYGCFRANWL